MRRPGLPLSPSPPGPSRSCRRRLTVPMRSFRNRSWQPASAVSRSSDRGRSFRSSVRDDRRRGRWRPRRARPARGGGQSHVTTCPSVPQATPPPARVDHGAGALDLLLGHVVRRTRAPRDPSLAAGSACGARSSGGPRSSLDEPRHGGAPELDLAVVAPMWTGMKGIQFSAPVSSARSGSRASLSSGGRRCRAGGGAISSLVSALSRAPARAPACRAGGQRHGSRRPRPCSPSRRGRADRLDRRALLDLRDARQDEQAEVGRRRRPCGEREHRPALPVLVRAAAGGLDPGALAETLVTAMPSTWRSCPPAP